jgi:hypothetical protein
MSGVKGRSGRRVKSVEERCLALRDKARETTLAALNDLSIPLIERAKIANPISVKEMAQKIEQTGVTPQNIMIIHSGSPEKPKIEQNPVNRIPESVNP